MAGVLPSWATSHRWLGGALECLGLAVQSRVCRLCWGLGSTFKDRSKVCFGDNTRCAPSGIPGALTWLWDSHTHLHPPQVLKF